MVGDGVGRFRHIFFHYICSQTSSIMKKILLIFISIVLCTGIRAHSDDIYEGSRARWARIAEKTTPVLNEELRRPVAIVKAVNDSNAFQGWRFENTGEPVSAAYEHDMVPLGNITVDFGEHLTGYFSFRVKTLKGDLDAPLRLKFFFAELPAEMNTPLEPWTGTLSRAWMQDEVITVTEPDQLMTIPRRLSFRYLRIEVLGVSPNYSFCIDRMEMKAVSSAGKMMTSLQNDCPEKIAKINEVGIRTLRECMQTVFEDGPKRDHRLWTGDLYLQALANRYSFKNFELVRHCLYLLASLSGPSGLVPSNVFETPVPHAQQNSYCLNYCMLYTSILLDYLKDTGDYKTARELWPVARRQVEVVSTGISDDGIFRHDWQKGWLFFDWRNGLDLHLPMQGAMIHGLDQACELAAMLGKEAETEGWKELADKMRKVVYERYYDADSGVASANGQTSVVGQVWMIRSGVLSAEEGAKALRNVLKDKSAVRPGTPYATHYLIDAMIRCGMTSEARQYLEDYWGGMIKKGADTFWEAYDPDDQFISPYDCFPLNSACHAWSCTPVYFIHKYPEIFQTPAG